MPPEAVALHVNALPVVTPDVGHVTVLLSAAPPTFTMTEPL